MRDPSSDPQNLAIRAMRENRMIHNRGGAAGVVGAIAEGMAGGLSWLILDALVNGFPPFERVATNGSVGLSQWRDHAGRAGARAGLGPGFPFWRLDLRGLADVSGPALARERTLARLKRSLKELDFPPVDLERLMERLHNAR